MFKENDHLSYPTVLDVYHNDFYFNPSVEPTPLRSVSEESFHSNVMSITKFTEDSRKLPFTCNITLTADRPYNLWGNVQNFHAIHVPCDGMLFLVDDFVRNARVVGVQYKTYFPQVGVEHLLAEEC